MKYRCTTCLVERPQQDFSPDKSARGFGYKCKPCQAETWRKRNPRDPDIYEFTPDFEVCQETVRRLLEWDETQHLFRWKVSIGKLKKGDMAGEKMTNRQNRRIFINGQRWREDDLLSIFRTGKPVMRKAKCKAMEIYEREWMREIKVPKFPDWSYEWQKERRKKAAKAQYETLSESERRERWRLAGSRRDKKAKSQYLARWKKANPKKISIYARNYNTKPKHKPKRNLRNRFKDLMRTTRNGGAMSLSNTIGCTTKQFAAYLEEQFTKRMTWDNYGTYWHVDHILPVSSFDHLDPNQVRLCWHWTNLRPMEAKANIAKSNTITQPQMSLLLPCT